MHTTTIVFSISALLIGASTILVNSSFRNVGNNQGYSPEQPIAYSHRLHAGQLGINCRYCHYGSERGRHAGIPSTSICMNCHAAVTDGFDATLAERERAKAAGEEPVRTVSSELRKLYDYVGLDEDLQPLSDSGAPAASSVPWQRIHQLPDFVYFDHSVHVAAGEACETCHGAVQSMERMRQEEDLSMGWCVNCHRASQPTRTSAFGVPDSAAHVSTNCVTCHL